MSTADNLATSEAHPTDDHQGGWAYQPPLPLQEVPVFVWPPRIREAIGYFFSKTYLFSFLIPFGALATFTWYFLQPAMHACATLEPGWIAQLFARNFILITLVAGALHLYFHVFKLQGSQKKFDREDMQRRNPRFLGNDQVLDNMFWTLASGVTVWTAYEVLFFWAYANNVLPHYLDIRNHPVAFVILLLLIPFWSSLHFHFVHRLLHHRALFKVAHAVHHRNVNLGPWSGLSMHPIEHLLYLSSVLIHLVIPSHPLHIIFHMQFISIGASTGHTGFESITFRGKPLIFLTAFHHQLHHRFLDCNYGNQIVGADRWFGCDHDGTPHRAAQVRARQLARNKARRQPKRRT